MDRNLPNGESRSIGSIEKISKENIKVQQLHITKSSAEGFVSDKNEFPSLSEVSEKSRSPKDTTSVRNTHFSYSDKLKLGQNQKVNNSALHSKYESTQNIPNNQLVNGKSLSNSNKKQFTEKKFPPAKHREIMDNKTSFLNNKHNVKFSSPQENINSKNMQSKVIQNQRFNQQYVSSILHNNSTSNKACGSNSEQENYSSPKNKKKTTIKPDDASKNSIEGTEPIIKKKNKKRKSKLKRQVALQSGKITVLTPEAHSKILNQSSSLNPQPSKSIVTDINDSEEYPELGKAFLPKIHKENTIRNVANCLKTEHDPAKQKDETCKMPTTCISSSSGELIEELPPHNSKEEFIETIDISKNDVKATIRPNEPIVVSFFDIFLTSKSKTKEAKEKMDSTKTVVPVKLKNKKANSHPHNLLDSSSPAIKRGKERENPRAKRPSHLKKIILLDRKTRKEQNIKLCLNHLVEPKQNSDVPSIAENSQAQLLKSSSFPDGSSEDKIATSNSRNLSVLSGEFQIALEKEKDLYLANDYLIDDKIALDNISSSPERTSSVISSVKDLFEAKQCKLDNHDQSFLVHLDDNHSSDYISETKNLENRNGNSVVIEHYNTGYQNNNNKVSALTHLDHSNSKNSTSNFEDCIVKTADNVIIKPPFLESEKLQAAKIAIHTRNFREYCSHLVSKDLDTAVLSLLDDLARFQDRMHQKDPVKARIKRRLVYGIKEVKKNVKLKKLKCIIIATDIENVQTEGGLNDALNDIKSSSADHHIPCIFALGKKRLGRVCHKPVAVSCVGVFNYEGSEVNFKKMIELHNQGKKDYAEILNNLICKLSNEAIIELFQARMEAPENLHQVRAKILAEFVSPVRNNDESESLNSEIEP